MQQQGWVSIHRSVLDNFVWFDKPFNMGAAWIDLILMANHEDNKFPVNGNLIVVKRGQTYTSCRSLAERWGWSLGKVKRFIDLLEREKMVNTERTKNGTLLTLVKYDNFQDTWNTNGTQTERRRNTNGTQTERNNNDNNENNENNDNKITPLPPSKEEREVRYFPDYELLEKTFADFRAMRKKIKSPMTDRAIELMVNKINKYHPDIAIKMMEQSIVNGWKDIYELKNDKGTSKESMAEKWGL